MPAEETVPLSVRVPQALRGRIERAREARRQTLTAWLTLAVERALSEQGASEPKGVIDAINEAEGAA